jgi:sigma-E factor negative regulatory protein RseA
MDKLSALMDGELDAADSKREIQRLENDARLTEEWHTYHLIRDALREELDLGPGFTRKLHGRLQQEPTVLAPRRLMPQPVLRHALPIAASVAGVAVVAWLALSSPVTTGPKAFVADLTSTPELQQSVAAIPAGTRHAGIPEYLVAHQEFSPSTAMQGVVSYVRTVSTEEPAQDR